VRFTPESRHLSCRVLPCRKDVRMSGRRRGRVTSEAATFFLLRVNLDRGQINEMIRIHNREDQGPFKICEPDSQKVPS